MKKTLLLLMSLALFTSIAIFPASATSLEEQTITGEEFFEILIKEYAKYDIRLVPDAYSKDLVFTKAMLEECIAEAKISGAENLAQSKEVIDLGSVYCDIPKTVNTGIFPRIAYSTQTLTGDPTYITASPAGSIRLRVSIDVKCDLANKRIVSASNVKVSYRGGVGYIGMNVVSTSVSFSNDTTYNAPLVRPQFTLDMHYQSSIAGLPVTQYITRTYTDTFYPRFS